MKKIFNVLSLAIFGLVLGASVAPAMGMEEKKEKKVEEKKQSGILFDKYVNNKKSEWGQLNLDINNPKNFGHFDRVEVDGNKIRLYVQKNQHQGEKGNFAKEYKPENFYYEFDASKEESIEKIVNAINENILQHMGITKKIHKKVIAPHAAFLIIFALTIALLLTQSGIYGVRKFFEKHPTWCDGATRWSKIGQIIFKMVNALDITNTSYVQRNIMIEVLALGLLNFAGCAVDTFRTGGCDEKKNELVVDVL